MKKVYLITFMACLFLSIQANGQCFQGIVPNQGFRGQVLTTTITNLFLFNGTGSAPCNPGDLFLYQSSTATTIMASTLSIVGDTGHVSWNIPSNAPTGVYDLNIALYPYMSGVGNCTIPPQNCIIPQQFGIAISVVSGRVFYDANQDSIYNAGDLLLPNQRVLLMPDSNVTFTDNSGTYFLFADSGNHTIKILSNGDFHSVGPDSININIGQVNIDSLDFSIYPNSFAYRTNVYINGRARCNTDQNYIITYQNSSVLPVNLIIKLLHSQNTFYLNSSIVPDSIVGDTVYFSVLGLAYSSGYFSVLFQIPGAGLPVNFDAIVYTYDLGGTIVAIDTTSLHQTTTCSFDPNDKAVHPAGVQAQHLTLFSEDLYYTIRFQNTGTDTAYDIHILDTLDASLDLNSLELLSSSHPVIVEAGLNGIIDFHFYNIMLPDSNVNEPASNGFVSYKIHTSQSLPELTVINNQAYIYFDQNVAVETNETENTMVSVMVGINELPENEGVVVYPNPYSESVSFMSKNNMLPHQLIITDIQGRQLYRSVLNGNYSVIDLHNLASGIYLYKLFNSDNARSINGRLIKQ